LSQLHNPKIRENYSMYIWQVCVRHNLVGVRTERYAGRLPKRKSSSYETPSINQDWSPLVLTDCFGRRF